jgi:transketolase
LVLLWADNGVSIDGVAQTDINMIQRMAAAGWKTLTVDGDDFVRINRAIQNAKQSDVPVFIQCKTQIGAGSSLSGSAKAHGFALDDSELLMLQQSNVSEIGDTLWGQVARGNMGTLMYQTDTKLPHVVLPNVGVSISMRELSGIYLNALLADGANIIGGSADLGGSTNVRVAASRDIESGDFSGNYINYGVREHAMAAIMNGMATCGLRVYGSTFLVFSDYMRPSIRLAAMSGLPVTYVFTHDSIAVGEDGPTHQPIEQLPSLRLIPNLNVFRPCNGNEIIYSWRRALTEKNKPSAIVLSRQAIRLVATPANADLSRGAYIIKPALSKRPRITIVATGSEVPLAIQVAEKLGVSVQVVSMLSVADFRMQDAEYKQKVLSGFVVAIEAAATPTWFEFADAVVGIDRFGLSGAGDAVYNALGFDVDLIVSDIKEKLK